MAKRLYDDDTSPPSKRVRTQNGDAESNAWKHANVKNSKLERQSLSAKPSDDADKLSREARKALKRAKKEDLRAQDAELDLGGELSKAERKALKLAKKQARKATTASQVKEGVNSSGSTSVTISTPEAPESVYTEHDKLAVLAQSEIDAFVSKNLLNTEDSLTQKYRPIISFGYLPSDVQTSAFANFSSPTPIQAAGWPYLLAGRDVIGVAETGSGKTLAFALPCVRHISRLSKKERKYIKACIVSPTRELAMQIYEQVSTLAEPAGLKAALVYGGMSKDVQRDALKGTQIVVATPGRLNDFIQEGSIDLSKVSWMVLDEADRLLETGFEEEVRRIISTTPPTGQRQTVMFTATWPQSVRDLAATYMDKPVKVTIGDNASGELRANAKITQEVEVIEDREKQGRLIELLKKYQSGKNKQDRILVFCLYKKEASRIEDFIRRKGFPVAGIHGDMSQQKRTESLDAFKQGRIPLLVATDVAARGLDIPAVKLVINFTFPLTTEDYVHRIGRSGRAGSDGFAITLFTNNEKHLAGGLVNVLRAANQTVPDALMKFPLTVKRKEHDAYGAFYRDPNTMKAPTKITFD